MRGAFVELMEQLDYNLLYRWFVGLSPDDAVWDPTSFTKNRERLQNGDVFTKFMTKFFEPSSGQAAIVRRAFFRWTGR
jgi:transposase